MNDENDDENSNRNIFILVLDLAQPANIYTEKYKISAGFFEKKIVK